MSVFVHAQGIKTVHTEGGGVKKWQISVHVVVECSFIIQMPSVLPKTAPEFAVKNIIL